MADPMHELLEGARRIAVVGASDDPSRASHRVMGTLLRAGYEVVPVNPKVEEVHGVPAVASLTEIEGDIDIVDVFRRAEHAPDVAREAVEAGAGTVWLQDGITSTEAREVAQEGGVGFVEDLCLGSSVRYAGLAG
jgi:uncharacterized protein